MSSCNRASSNHGIDKLLVDIKRFPNQLYKKKMCRKKNIKKYIKRLIVSFSYV